MFLVVFSLAKLGLNCLNSILDSLVLFSLLRMLSFLQFVSWSHRGDWQTTMTSLTYTEMCTQSIEAPLRSNVFAAFYSWITLAGFLVFPATFTSPQYNDTLKNIKGVQIVEGVVRRLPLGVAITCCIFGIMGTCVLWYVWRNNFIWLRAMFW